MKEEVLAPMTADQAQVQLTAKLQAKAIPPGIIGALLAALAQVFTTWCPSVPPTPKAMKTTAQEQLADLQAGGIPSPTRRRFRMSLFMHGLRFRTGEIDQAEQACWEIAAESSEQEIATYVPAWQQERISAQL